MADPAPLRGLGGWLRRWPVRIGGGCLIAALLAFAVNTSLSAFARSHNFLDRISAKTAQELKAPAGYLPLQWRGLSVYSEGFLAQGIPGQALTKLEAQGLHARCDLMSLWHGVFVLHELDMQSLQVAYGNAAADQITEELSHKPELRQPATTDTPLKVDVRKTTLNRASILWGKEASQTGALRDLTAILYTVDKNLDVTGHGGTFQQSGWPDMKVTDFQLYYAKPNLFVKQARLRFGEEDNVLISGQFTFAEKSDLKLAAKFENCPISAFLSNQWRKKFSGDFSSQTTFTKTLNESSPVDVSGSLRFNHATLQGLEAQDKLAVVTRNEQFHRLKFNKLKCNFTHRGSTTEVSDFEAEVAGLIAVEGDFAIKEENINGSFKVGAKPAVLETIPGARERVFTESREGYLWTPVKVTGPLKHPRENLKSRLVAAARDQILQSIFKPITEPENQLLKLLDQLFE